MTGRKPASPTPADVGEFSDVELVLDLSRLVSRVRHATPTGVDRVELAYARELQRRVPARLRFAALHPGGLYGRIPTMRAQRFLDEVERLWTNGVDATTRRSRGWPSSLRTLMLTRPAPVPPAHGPRVLLQSSPHHLHRTRSMQRILARERSAFVCLLHDLIPLQYPEYARPGGAALHMRRMRTVATLADAVIANSHATANAFAPHLVEAGRPHVPVTVAHLGLDTTPVVGPVTVGDSYFVCVGTIEPRKNHLLLLHLWRRMAEDRAAGSLARVPRLVLIGRRGWENEQVVDMLDRCPALAGLVEERTGLPDGEMRALMAGSLGLLLPSFAEGFGMPVPEALAMRVPVLCSDIPALREAGGDAPTYLDPLDGPAWRQAVLALADPSGTARAAQLARIDRWRPADWERHLSIVLGQIAQVVAR